MLLRQMYQSIWPRFLQVCFLSFALEAIVLVCVSDGTLSVFEGMWTFIDTQPLLVPVPWLHASGPNKTERKVVCSDAGLFVTWLPLFFSALFLLWQQQIIVLRWQQMLEVFGQPFSTYTELVIDFVGCEQESRGTLLSPSCMLTFFYNKTKLNNMSTHVKAALHSSGTKCHLRLTCNWRAILFGDKFLAVIQYWFETALAQSRLVSSTWCVTVMAIIWHEMSKTAVSFNFPLSSVFSGQKSRSSELHYRRYFSS